MQGQNVKNCKDNLKQNQHELELVKDSITTTEVFALLLSDIEICDSFLTMIALRLTTWLVMQYTAFAGEHG